MVILCVRTHGQGADLVNLIFGRAGSALVDIIPYCWANASDFWEMSSTFHIRHYG